jgi:hypothetical protein
MSKIIVHIKYKKSKEAKTCSEVQDLKMFKDIVDSIKSLLLRHRLCNNKMAYCIVILWLDYLLSIIAINRKISSFK